MRLRQPGDRIGRDELRLVDAHTPEVLADFQITSPEIGTVKADQPPIVVITSNRTREIHDAIKRRCFYYWVDYPKPERELEILRLKAPNAPAALSATRVESVRMYEMRPTPPSFPSSIPS